MTRAALVEVAGPVYFARGEEYYDIGAVNSIRERDGVIRATVDGTNTYRTILTFDGKTVDGQCSCPLGQDLEFCKHLVATGLQYIAQEKGRVRTEKKGKPGKKKKAITSKDIEGYLLKLDTSELVRMIMEQADFDDELYAMLKMRVAVNSDAPNTSEMRNILRRAMTIDDFVSWHDTYDYIRGIDQVLEELNRMLTPGLASQVVEISECGIDIWEESINSIDDSSGCMGTLLDDLQKLHLKACRIAKPDPIKLAERMAKRAISSEWDMFFDSYEAYKKLLGKAGRARYREIVEKEWNTLPSLKPGEDDSERYGRSYRLEHMMLAFADEDKDFDLSIRVLSRDLSNDYRYLSIAEFCRSKRKYKLAREWAEKGVAAFSDSTDSRLRSFLAEEYSRSKRPDDAMAMIFANFEERTGLETYRDLVKYARKFKCLDTYRKKAFAYIRRDLKDRKAEYKRENAGRSRVKNTIFSRWAPSPPDHSLLVNILLWEKHVDEAWAEASKGGCSNQLWLDLARQREKKHPKGSIEIYRRQVVPLIEQTNNDSYKEAIEFLGRIHRLMKKTGREKEFYTWLEQLTTEHKRKRNFIKHLQGKAWGVVK